MYKKILFIPALLVFLLFNACKTYTIPTESFREQMITAKMGYMKPVEINNPLFYSKIAYPSNNIKRLIVEDNDGKKLYLDNSPSIEMRVTQNNGKKYIMYFDTVILENDTLKGGRSRFIQDLTRMIPMDSIVKIEVQDGGKNYKYNN